MKILDDGLWIMDYREDDGSEVSEAIGELRSNCKDYKAKIHHPSSIIHSCDLGCIS
jgi:hypothetical protein